MMSPGIQGYVAHNHAQGERPRHAEHKRALAIWNMAHVYAEIIATSKGFKGSPPRKTDAVPMTRDATMLRRCQGMAMHLTQNWPLAEGSNFTMDVTRVLTEITDHAFVLEKFKPMFDAATDMVLKGTMDVPHCEGHSVPLGKRS